MKNVWMILIHFDGNFTYICISVPPEAPVIVNEAGREATSQLGPYDEGSSVQISCEVSGGNRKFSNLGLFRF